MSDVAGTQADRPPMSVADLLTALEAIAANWSLLDGMSADERRRFQRAIAAIHHPDPIAHRRRTKAAERERKARAAARDRVVLHATGIRTGRRGRITTPNVFPPRALPDEPVAGAADPRAVDPKHCYICKQMYADVHHFYDQLCPPCASLNFGKRGELANLAGRVALVTGARVKIGYQAALKLLRSGAAVVATSRFPRDAARRYAAEPDFHAWSGRLEIFGLDLRHTPSVEAFCGYLLASRSQLDFIVNNACQTVRRPPDFYRHMMAREAAALADLPAGIRKLIGAYEGLRGDQLIPERAPDALATLDARLTAVAGLTHAARLSQVALLPDEVDGRQDLFPVGQLDADLQQVDLRGRNSWRLMLPEVSAVELLEVQLVNAVAPFILNGRLKPLLMRSPTRDKHVVNVSAVEGQFYRRFKTSRHPHTNMAKAALNMMTRTAAAYYQADGIHMNSVDTGWVTDEDPAETAARKIVDHGFHPPLDAVDGAARVVDPIVSGFNSGVHVWGRFLKDYRPTDW